mmetsp:Transcript_33736/g.76372  ORF Transcript_33736/g.76372 Transcript_33736/m.76372 type:complete len:222 (-) Transcript_33736:101-766(-)
MDDVHVFVVQGAWARDLWVVRHGGHSRWRGRRGQASRSEHVPTRIAVVGERLGVGAVDHHDQVNGDLQFARREVVATLLHHTRQLGHGAVELAHPLNTDAIDLNPVRPRTSRICVEGVLVGASPRASVIRVLQWDVVTQPLVARRHGRRWWWRRGGHSQPVWLCRVIIVRDARLKVLEFVLARQRPVGQFDLNRLDAAVDEEGVPVVVVWVEEVGLVPFHV